MAKPKRFLNKLIDTTSYLNPGVDLARGADFLSHYTGQGNPLTEALQGPNAFLQSMQGVGTQIPNNLITAFTNLGDQRLPGMGGGSTQNPEQKSTLTPTTDTTVFDSMKNQPLSENSPYITSQKTGSTDPHWYAQLDSSTYGSPFRMPTHNDATAAGVGITLKALGGSNADPDAVALFQQSADDALMQQADQIRQNGGVFTSIDYWNTLGLLWQHIQAQVAQQKAPPSQTTTNTAGQNGNPIMTSQGVFKP